MALSSEHARHTARALEQGLSLLPHRPKTVLSDNGSEFEAHFARLLEKRDIGRWYTYPETTANWPTGWSSTTPSDRTTPLASNPRYPSS